MKVFNLSTEHTPNGDFFSQTIAATAAAITGSNLPATATHVLITVEGGDGRVRFDGTAPTSSEGHPVYAGTSFTWRREMALAAKFIRSGTDSMVLKCTPLSY